MPLGSLVRTVRLSSTLFRIGSSCSPSSTYGALELRQAARVERRRGRHLDALKSAGR